MEGTRAGKTTTANITAIAHRVNTESVNDRPASPSERVTYSSYLAIDELLAAQRPRTEHPDELLFIVIHQVYELWFKQLLHEAARMQSCLADGAVTGAARAIERMLTILKTIVAQVDVLETMTPAQFAAFRGALDSSSGFQSAQFREVEVMLGRRDERALAPFSPGSPERARIAAAMGRPSLFDSLLAYLAGAGYPVPAAVLAREVSLAHEPSDEVQQALLRVYEDDGAPAALCERMVDLDEGVMEWRYRHVQMVRRMIGSQPGTGGSAGVDYLASTLMQPSFPDLWAVRGKIG
jgi:tryptophan 2,3-dioxygenase